MFSLRFHTLILLCLSLCSWNWMHRYGVEGFDVRLQPPVNDTSATNRGTVEIRFNSSTAWGTVCDDDFELADATVICSMLGFRTAISAHGKAEFGQGTGLVIASQLSCIGTETNINQCPRAQQADIGCNHTEDAGVTCFQEAPTRAPVIPTVSSCTADPTMRIVDGSNAATGRVEVQRNGVWGTVCNNGFDYLAARVVCAGLCFDTSFAKPYYPRAQAPTTTPASSILMDNLRCDGTEYNLLNCSHTQSNLCQHSDDARVSCVDLPDSPPQPPAPDLVCREKDMEVAFNKTIHPSLQIDDLSQFEGDPGCTPARGSNSTFVTISLPYSTCASLNSSNDSHIIYSVNIKYDLLVPGNLLTRLHIFKIPAYCLFPRLLDASVPFRPVTQTAPPVIGGANFDVDMFIYQDDSFQTPVASYPHNITLGQYLNTAVVLNSDDTSLKQVVSDCWATTDDNSSSAPTYELIKDKCSSDPTVDIIPLSYRWFGFRVQSFIFNGGHELVYIYCKVRVCNVNERGSECTQSCGSRKRKRRSSDQSEEGLTKKVQQGPINIIADPQTTLPSLMSEPEAITAVPATGDIQEIYQTELPLNREAIDVHLDTNKHIDIPSVSHLNPDGIIPSSGVVSTYSVCLPLAVSILYACLN